MTDYHQARTQQSSLTGTDNLQTNSTQDPTSNRTSSNVLCDTFSDNQNDPIEMIQDHFEESYRNQSVHSLKCLSDNEGEKPVSKG